MARYFNGTSTHFKVGNANALHLPDGDWTLAGYLAYGDTGVTIAAQGRF
jgi:hypothetical protein